MNYSPRNVRNFWVDLNVDGHTAIATGPKPATGGFEQTILVRSNGAPHKALDIRGYVNRDGDLVISVSADDECTPEHSGQVWTHTYKR